MTLSDILPARLRYAVYVTLVLAGVALGTIQVWCAAAEIAVPTWHAPALAVLGYLSAAVGLVAAANVAPPAPELTDDQRANLTLLRDALEPGDPARNDLNVVLATDDPANDPRYVHERDIFGRRHDDA